jgi:hypothetical protein
MNLAYKTVLELKEMIENNEVTSPDVWSYFLERAKNQDENL